MGGREVIEQLLVGGRLLQRVELLPVQVLQQRVPQQVRRRPSPARWPGSASRPASWRPATGARPSRARSRPGVDLADDDRAGAARPGGSSRPARPGRPRRRPAGAVAGWARWRPTGTSSKYAPATGAGRPAAGGGVMVGDRVQGAGVPGRRRGRPAGPRFAVRPGAGLTPARPGPPAPGAAGTAAGAVGISAPSPLPSPRFGCGIVSPRSRRALAGAMPTHMLPGAAPS